MPFMLFFLPRLRLSRLCHHPGNAFSLVHNAKGRTNPPRLRVAGAQPAKQKVSDDAISDAGGVSEALLLRIHTVIKGYGVKKPAIRKALSQQSITSEADISDATAIGELSAVISFSGKTKDGKQIKEVLTKEFLGIDGKSVVAESEQLALSMGELLDRKKTPSGEDLMQLEVFQEMVVELLAKLPASKDLSREDERKISQTLSRLAGDASRLLKQTSKQEKETRREGRVATVDFDILETTMSYRFDLVRFLKNVQDLFQWHEKKQMQNEFLAPYFPLIQSSGTGKTKLLYEACKELNAQGNFLAKLILCTDEYEPTPLPSKLKVFTDILTVPSNSHTEEDRDKVIGFLNSLVNAAITKNNVDGVNQTKNVVLFFDESQWLTSKNSGFFFRDIRWWLKKIRENIKIVAVFAGTTSVLANYYADSPPDDTSRNAKEYIKGGEKLYQPFFQLTTIGLLANIGSPPNRSLSEYKQAIPYGRPLFACMDQNGQLEDKFLGVMKRMLLSSPDFDDDNYFATLGTRVQMGQVSFDMASKLVGNRYAHLTNFENGKECFADVAFLPDPVCARIAMSQMVKGCSLLDNEFPGKPPSFWTTKAIGFFSRGLCRPPRGDLGEVAAALYLLFCGDMLRHKVSPDLTHFSISLNDWIEIMDCPGNMAEGGSTSQESSTSQHESLPGEEVPFTNKTSTLDETSDLKEAAASVSFIQICRNYLRPTLESLSKNGLLEEWYKAGRAVYTYPSCPSYDILAPIRYRTQGSYFYCPLLISVKNCATLSKEERRNKMKAMEEVFKNANLETGVGFLVMVGLEKNQKCLLERPQQLFVPGKLTFVEIVVSSNDPFGVSSLASGDTGELAEVYTSHAEVSIQARLKQEWPHLLRTSSRASDDSFQFEQDMRAALSVSQKEP